jgi:hypothetical protein
MTLAPKKGYMTGNSTLVLATRKENPVVPDADAPAAAATDEPSTADLEAQLAAKKEKEQAEKAAAVSNPLLDQVAAADGSRFIDKLRNVAADLKEAGQIGESELVSAGEEGSLTATLIKLVGEVVDKLNA